MGFKCGIVGLPNVGKSTLFNALTKAGIEAANYPFCTIEPNVGIVTVPDPRLDALSDIVKPQQVLPATMQFVDIAGIVKGASKGEGLGNQFLANIRETDAIAHVVRCFENTDVVHVEGKVHPLSDIEVINTELALADMETLEKAILKAGKNSRSGNKEAIFEMKTLEKIKAHLDEGYPVRTLELSTEEEPVARRLFCSLPSPFFISPMSMTRVMKITPCWIRSVIWLRKKKQVLLPYVQQLKLSWSNSMRQIGRNLWKI